MQVDDDGIVWFCVFDDGKIDRFDPKTETFKEFPLPNAKSHPTRSASRPITRSGTPRNRAT